MGRLIAFGDSFTFGTDLKDCIETDNFDQEEKYLNEQYPNGHIGSVYEHEPDINNRKRIPMSFNSNLTWPALLAKDLDMQYICHARQGASNNQIARLIYNYINEFRTNDLIIVNWTWIDRSEYYNELLQPKYQWQQIRPPIDSEHAKLYYKYFFSELSSKYETLKNILAIQNLLTVKNILFRMTCIDDLTINTKWHIPDYVANMQNEIKNNIMWFNNSGFYQWSKDNNFAIHKDNGHPLEEAHEAAFNYLKDNYGLTK